MCSGGADSKQTPACIALACGTFQTQQACVITTARTSASRLACRNSSKQKSNQTTCQPKHLTQPKHNITNTFNTAKKLLMHSSSAEL
jgi:hypothetical protein